MTDIDRTSVFDGPPKEDEDTAPNFKELPV